MKATGAFPDQLHIPSLDLHRRVRSKGYGRSAMRPMSLLALLGSTLTLLGFVPRKPPEACKLLTLEAR
jgi:hypothetical protein